MVGWIDLLTFTLLALLIALASMKMRMLYVEHQQVTALQRAQVTIIGKLDVLLDVAFVVAQTIREHDLVHISTLVTDRIARERLEGFPRDVGKDALQL